jgi:hypothetical protein
VNRGPTSEYNPWPGLPSIRRIFVRDLTAESHGNAVGIGIADVTTDRLVRRIDWAPTRINAQSSGTTSRIRVPVPFSTDRDALQWVTATAGKLDPADATFGWIRNTLELSRVAISHNLRAQLDGQPQAEVEGEIEVEWDEHGNLVSPF